MTVAVSCAHSRYPVAKDRKSKCCGQERLRPNPCATSTSSPSITFQPTKRPSRRASHPRASCAPKVCAAPRCRLCGSGCSEVRQQHVAEPAPAGVGPVDGVGLAFLMLGCPVSVVTQFGMFRTWRNALPLPFASWN